MKILIAAKEFHAKMALPLPEWGYELVYADDGMRAWEILQSDAAPSLVVLERDLPVFDGVELCRRLHANTGEQSIPYIIMLAPKWDAPRIAEALHAGADDLIDESVDQEIWQVRLHVARRALDLQHQLQNKGGHDDLTGLLTRPMILEILVREFGRAVRYGKPLSIMLFDLDMFKQVNQRFGHREGDTVLRTAAERILSTLRNEDYVGRFGGDVFLMLLPGCNHNFAQEVAERLRFAIVSAPVVSMDHHISFTTSIGIATKDLSHINVEMLLRSADEALYRAKAAGGNRVEGSQDAAILEPDDAK